MALKNIWRTREKRLVEHTLSLTGIRRDPRDSGLVCARLSSHVQTFRTSACDASLSSFHICFWSCNSKIPFLFDLVASLLLFFVVVFVFFSSLCPFFYLEFNGYLDRLVDRGTLLRVLLWFSIYTSLTIHFHTPFLFHLFSNVQPALKGKSSVNRGSSNE